tara:strand:+ start:769 stop:873 length:105 start_codon:yes stop_codon:yes gene_type:complete
VTLPGAFLAACFLAGLAAGVAAAYAGAALTLVPF